MSYLSPIAIKNDANFVLYEMPAGKPSKADPMARVVQKQQKGETCWYYAYKKIMTESDSQQHQVFKTFSNVRKQLTQDPENRIAIKEKALRTQLGASYDSLEMETFRGLFPNLPPSFSSDKIPDYIRKDLPDPMFIRFLIKSCKLRVSTWSIRDPIDRMISELKEKGPLVVGGQFSTIFYSQAPFHYKTICDREIYAWKPKTRYPCITKGIHSVVVVGAEKNPKGQYIYYIDPNDESDPKNPSSQKIYLVSYRTFSTYVYDACGFHKDVLPISSYGYGVHAKKASS